MYKLTQLLRKIENCKTADDEKNSYIHERPFKKCPFSKQKKPFKIIPIVLFSFFFLEREGIY